MARKKTKSEAPKKIKPISLNILEIAKRLQTLEQTSGGGGDTSALANKSDIATEFNTTTAYTAGCFVYHEGKLYQFNADHAAGAWDPTDVVEANVTDQIVSNSSAINGLDTELEEKISTDEGTFEDGDSNTYTGVTVDMLSYDETNNQLLMKVDGADTVIPFSHGSGGTSQVDTGTFTSAAEQYGLTTVNCGFEPDLVIVILPFQNGDTTSYWWREASWSATSAIWSVAPAEPNINVVALGRTTGETGIQAINSNGFAFMSNGANTRNVTCKYLALKY